MPEHRIDLIPFLMHRVITKVVARATRDFEELGLNIQMSRLLNSVRANPGIRVGQLADVIGLEISGMSHLLRRMTRMRLVRRSRAEDDQRAVAVHLTPEGERMAERCLAISRHHESLMLEGIAPETAAYLRQLLGRMLVNVDAAIPEATDGSIDVSGRRRTRPPGAGILKPAAE